MKTLLTRLLSQFSDHRLRGSFVIPWSSPVPVFGDLRSSYVATLGLNPSNREFMDELGRELTGPSRRFETLNSLGLREWTDVSAQHLRRIWSACESYFTNNPYDGWFKRLDALIADTRASYYDRSAAHLDLIPYATSCKWGNLTSKQRNALLGASGSTLAWLLRESPIRILVLNGTSVVAHFQSMFSIELQKCPMRSWSLRRMGTYSVPGYAYMGRISALAGMSLGREIRVLGFNHNIQSSFGVTSTVTASIKEWIGLMSEECLGET